MTGSAAAFVVPEQPTRPQLPACLRQRKERAVFRPIGQGNDPRKEPAMIQQKRARIPRGLKQEGLALWSYGFRPFFLDGAI